MAHVPNDDLPRAEWVRVAHALFAAAGGAAEARAAFLAWSAKSKKHTRAGTPQKVWDSFVKAPPRRITGATLYALAYANGWLGWMPDAPETPEGYMDAVAQGDRARPYQPRPHEPARARPHAPIGRARR